MKNILEKIIAEDTTYNKSATRYLYKTHPDLWDFVLSNTSFLPETSLAKQRVWHILNNVLYIPKCPITGENLKWWENRYLSTINRSAKTKLQHIRGDFENLYSPEINEKRSKTNLETVNKGRKYRDKSTYTDKQKLKFMNTCLEKYGVDNPSKCPKIQQKLSDAATKRYSGVDRTEINQYYKEVKKITKRSWKKYWHLINLSGVTRSPDWHLDHIFSIKEGFSNSIPAEIIGHWTNLRIIAREQNSSKGSDCHKTKEQLYEDYYNSLG